jgi:TP901-1 family phage major tail protein
MTNYKGRDFLLKLGTWSSGNTIAGGREHTLRYGHELVDVTNKGSNGYRTLLEGAGTKSVSVTFSGVIENDAYFETFQGYANAGSINAMALGWADGDKLEGSFMISTFEISGAHNNEQTFTATLESSGEWTYTGA